MPYKSLPKLTSSALLDLILIHASITAENTFLTTPHYDRLSQSQAAWREVLKTLEEPATVRAAKTPSIKRLPSTRPF